MSTLLFGYVSEVTDPAQLLADDSYIAEEKLNGMRLQLIKTTNVVTGYTRQGIEWALPIRTREAAMMTADSYHVDGELLPSGEFVCFDILSYKGADVRPWMNHSRLQFEISLPFRFVRRAVETLGKETLMQIIKAEGGEGLVFKRWDAPYQYDYGFKYKFYRSETFRIVSVDIAKNTATIERAGNIMGSVIFARDTWPLPGQLCEVRFDAVSESGKLLRPKWLGIRVDVDAATLETPILK